MRSGRDVVLRRSLGPAMRMLLSAETPGGGGGFCGLLKTLLERRDGRTGLERLNAGAASPV